MVPSRLLTVLVWTSASTHNNEEDGWEGSAEVLLQPTSADACHAEALGGQGRQDSESPGDEVAGEGSPVLLAKPRDLLQGRQEAKDMGKGQGCCSTQGGHIFWVRS